MWDMCAAATRPPETDRGEYSWQSSLQARQHRLVPKIGETSGYYGGSDSNGIP